MKIKKIKGGCRGRRSQAEGGNNTESSEEFSRRKIQRVRKEFSKRKKKNKKREEPGAPFGEAPMENEKKDRA